MKGPAARAYHREWNRTHPTQTRKWLYAWRKKNPDKKKRIDRVYYERHRKQRIAASHKWYQANRARRIASNTDWRKRHPEVVKLQRHNRETLLSRTVIPDASLTPERLKALRDRQKEICGICDKPMSNGYTLDHIIPLSKGGHHAIYNIQLAHHHCNSMKQDKLTEKDVQKAIVEYLGYKKIFFYRNNSGAFKRDDGHFYRFGATGSPDIVCVVKGQFVGIEVKAPKGRQSDHQKEFQRQLEAAGGRYILAYSIDDVVQQIAPLR